MKKIALLLFAAVLIFSCETTTKKEVIPSKDPNSFALVIHGGAGGIERAYFTEEQQEAYTLKLQEVIGLDYSKVWY